MCYVEYTVLNDLFRIMRFMEKANWHLEELSYPKRKMKNSIAGLMGRMELISLSHSSHKSRLSHSHFPMQNMEKISSNTSGMAFLPLSGPRHYERSCRKRNRSDG